MSEKQRDEGKQVTRQQNKIHLSERNTIKIDAYGFLIISKYAPYTTVTTGSWDTRIRAHTQAGTYNRETPNYRRTKQRTTSRSDLIKFFEKEDRKRSQSRKLIELTVRTKFSLLTAEE